MILTMIPYCAADEGTTPEPGKDYGWAINQAMTRLHDDDWAFIIDHDCSLTTRHWYRALERAVARYPDAGFFTPMRYPANTKWLEPQGWLPAGPHRYDVREHRRVGQAISEKYKDQIDDVTDFEKLEGGLPAAGCWLISKASWTAVGGFKNGFKQENVDYDMHRRMRALGRRIYLLREVFLFHAKGL